MIRLGEEKGTLKDWVCMEESRLAALGLAVVKRGGLLVLLSHLPDLTLWRFFLSSLIHTAQPVAHPRS